MPRPNALPDSENHPAGLLRALPKNERHFVIFNSSEERGRPWCRDCENAQGPIDAFIAPGESTVVRVGDRAAWYDPANVWRQAPFALSNVPTIIRLPFSGEVPIEEKIEKAERLVETEILDLKKLRRFVSQPLSPQDT